jgi:hypothetical protein
MSNNWIVQLEEDKTTGELLLPFPPDLLSQMGWSEGTDLSWIVNDNGTVSIKEKEKSSDDDNSTAG